jgi:hypothetical protein
MAKDNFWTKTTCDRCHKPLNGARIMSMYNQDCLCMDCKQKESEREDYPEAVKAEREAVAKGDYNFKGYGL